MIVRELKLKLTKAQELRVNEWLNILTGVYNWGIRKIELDAKDRIYHQEYNFKNLLAGHSKKLDISSHTIQSILGRSWDAWVRCFNKIAKKPKFKGQRNKLRSIPFPDVIKPPKHNRICLRKLGWIKFHKQTLPSGKIKRGVIVKRASGCYLLLTIDADYVSSHKIAMTSSIVGIDTGFKKLLVLSNGIKYDHPKELQTGAKRLAQAQRGNNRYLIGRLQERQKNQRKDRNHKISDEIVESHDEIYITNDNLRAMSSGVHGKSVRSSAIGQLRNFILYKGNTCGRRVVFVDSRRTTMTCSECGALTGPTGWDGLAVRDWECSACGAQHDRDVNAARVVLMTGLGCSLENGWKAVSETLNQQCHTSII